LGEKAEMMPENEEEEENVEVRDLTDEEFQ
jgi:hypothetical protein